MPEAALLLENITCTIASNEGAGKSYTAVKEASIAIAPGEFVSVVGPTGCGKSTLLNVGAGLLQPSRSEEHTSELQSLMRISYAVFCLKKKKTNKKHTIQQRR